MELDNLYQVKFKRNGQWRFGVVYPSDEETKTKWEKGIVVVNDAIRPNTWDLQKDQITPVSMEVFPNEFDEYLEAELERALEHSKSRKGLQVGSLFYLGVADGSAYYVVTKVARRKCKIEWRGFGGDRYTDQTLGWGGTFDREIIEKHVGRQHSLAELFDGDKE